jgi:carbamoyltransferase
LEEKAEEYFELQNHSPFMLLAPRVKEDKKDVIPAVTHVDGTARVQTLSEQQNPILYRLIRDFEALSGVPVLVNTSLNLRGEPIACSPEDALSCFERSEMDFLVMGNWVVEKKQ